MTDAELQTWWPELGIVVRELRRAGHASLAQALLDAVRRGSMGSEILGDVGLVLRRHRAVRGQLGKAGKGAWDAVMADVNRHSHLARLVEWLRRWIG